MPIIHDSRLPKNYLEAIEKHYSEQEMFSFGANCFKAGSNVYESVKFHPDIFFFQVDKKTLIYSPDLDIRCLKPIRDRGVILVEGEKAPFGKYPDTCRYNVLKIGKYLFHNLKYTDSAIIKEALICGYEIFDVKQGYAGCSSLVVNEKAIITADLGIRNAVLEQDIDVLLVSSGEVILPGENYGFLGGSSGSMPDGSILVSGDLARHTDHAKIEQFLKKYNPDIFNIKGHDLYDSGSFIVV